MHSVKKLAAFIRHYIFSFVSAWLNFIVVLYKFFFKKKTVLKLIYGVPDNHILQFFKHSTFQTHIIFYYSILSRIHSFILSKILVPIVFIGTAQLPYWRYAIQRVARFSYILYIIILLIIISSISIYLFQYINKGHECVSI